MRAWYSLMVVGLLLVIGFLVWRDINHSVQTTSRQTAVTLTDLPVHYCPKQVQVVVDQANQPRVGKIIALKNCRTIELSSVLGTSTVGQISFKLPLALPFQINVADFGTQPVTYAPELGDLNDDAVIDARDESLVSDNLFSSDNQFDLDNDGQVSVLDVALVRLHLGASYQVVDPPIDWSEVGQ